MSTSVFCTGTLPQIDRIIHQLQVAGFSGNDISVLLADKGGTRDFAIEHNTKAPEGAVAGAGTGVAVGGVLGWLAGVGTLAVPGVGPLIAAGPIMAALSGAAIGGTVGGITGALAGLGMPEFEARRYEGKVKAGSALISVHAADSLDEQRITEIFESAGAEDVTTSVEAAASGR